MATFVSETDEMEVDEAASVPATESVADSGEENFGLFEDTSSEHMELNVSSATPSVRCFLNRPFNSTSTVIASTTMANPNMGQIFFCLASVLQAQLVEDDELPPEIRNMHPVFNLIPQIKAEYGGVVEHVTEESALVDAPDDPVLRAKLLNKSVPHVDTIVRFMKLLQQCGKYSEECNILALVYLNRMNSTQRFALTMTNWRAVWLSCIIIAQKMWDDRPLKTSAFTVLVPPIQKVDLKNFEQKALSLLDYAVGVKPSVYVKYYFELRQLFTTIMGFNSTDWQLRPLTVVKSKRLEAIAGRIALSPFVKGAASGGPSGSGSSSSSTALATRQSVESSGASSEVKAGMTLEDHTHKSQARFVLS